MQQYFIDKKLNVNENVELRNDIIYHLTKVLRSTNTVFRLADTEGNIFLCELDGNNAFVKEKLEENNELNVDVTVILSLYKQDKFELTLQKLTELGVKRIVPYNAYRSVVKETKAEKKLDRYKKILTEAAEQSHRNFVPEIVSAINIKEVEKYKSELNLIAYEKEDASNTSSFKAKSITFVIGPEGGFDLDELDKFKKIGFKSISLGKRILRAETAAMFLASAIVKDNEL